MTENILNITDQMGLRYGARQGRELFQNAVEISRTTREGETEIEWIAVSKDPEEQAYFLLYSVSNPRLDGRNSLVFPAGIKRVGEDGCIRRIDSHSIAGGGYFYDKASGKQYVCCAQSVSGGLKAGWIVIGPDLEEGPPILNSMRTEYIPIGKRNSYQIHAKEDGVSCLMVTEDVPLNSEYVSPYAQDSDLGVYFVIDNVRVEGDFLFYTYRFEVRQNKQWYVQDKAEQGAVGLIGIRNSSVPDVVVAQKGGDLPEYTIRCTADSFPENWYEPTPCRFRLKGEDPKALCFAHQQYVKEEVRGAFEVLFHLENDLKSSRRLPIS